MHARDAYPSLVMPAHYHCFQPTQASPLLRQLLDGEKLQPAHRVECFEAIKAAFASPENCTNPQLRKEYSRLVQSFERRREFFIKPERVCLDVYKLWGLIQNELFTDCNFQFNKVCGWALWGGLWMCTQYRMA